VYPVRSVHTGKRTPRFVPQQKLANPYKKSLRLGATTPETSGEKWDQISSIVGKKKKKAGGKSQDKTERAASRGKNPSPHVARRSRGKDVSTRKTSKPVNKARKRQTKKGRGESGGLETA